MIHPFIFKTVAAEHKARLQSAEHESKERRWCWHLVYSQGNNSPQVLYKISETSYKTKKRAFILAEIIRICKGREEKTCKIIVTVNSQDMVLLLCVYCQITLYATFTSTSRVTKIILGQERLIRTELCMFYQKVELVYT